MPISAGPPRAGRSAATGAQDVLSLATPLTGTLNVTGSLSAKATGAVGDALGGLLGGNVAKQIGSVNIKNLNASAEIKGNVVIIGAAEDRRELAHRAQPRRAGQSQRLEPQRGGRARQRARAGEAVDRQECRRADRTGAGAHAQRSGLRAERAGAMGQGLPLDPAAGHDGRLDDADAVAGIAPHPGDCRAAAHRRFEPHADARHRGGDPHHAGRDQARPARSPPRSSSCRRRRDGSRSAFPSTCPSPRSTKSWKRSSPEKLFRKTAPARSTSPSSAPASRRRATAC